MVVYVEYVFADNFFIDYVLLKYSCVINGETPKKRKLIPLAFLGAGFALLVPLFSVPPAVSAFIKILFGLSLAFLASPQKTLKGNVRYALTFFGLTAAAGGGVVAVYYAFGVRLGEEFSVALSILPAYLALKIILRLIPAIKKRRELTPYILKTDITVAGKTVTLSALADTGNGLTFGSSPVIVVSKSAVSDLITPKTFKSAGRITVNTVNGSSQKICFPADETVIYFGTERNIFNNVTVCVTEEEFDGYRAILNRALLVKEI